MEIISFAKSVCWLRKFNKNTSDKESYLLQLPWSQVCLELAVTLIMSKNNQIQIVQYPKQSILCNSGVSFEISCWKIHITLMTYCVSIVHIFDKIYQSCRRVTWPGSHVGIRVTASYPDPSYSIEHYNHSWHQSAL